MSACGLQLLYRLRYDIHMILASLRDTCISENQSLHQDIDIRFSLELELEKEI